MAWRAPPPITDLVREVLGTFQGPPWPADITLQVACEIENNQNRLAIYAQCLRPDNYGFQATHQGIGRAVRTITDLVPATNDRGRVIRRKVNGNLVIRSYTVLREHR